MNTDFVKWYTPKLQAELKATIIPFMERALKEKSAPAAELRRTEAVINKIADCSRPHCKKPLRKAPTHIGQYPEFREARGVSWDDKVGGDKIYAEYSKLQKTPEFKVGEYFYRGGPSYDLYTKPEHVIKETSDLLKIAKNPAHKAALEVTLQMARDMVPVVQALQEIKKYKTTKTKEKYEAPKAAMETCKEIHELLIKITKKTHDELLRTWVKDLNGMVNAFFKSADGKQSMYNHFHEKSHFGVSFSYNFVHHLVEESHTGFYKDRVYTFKKIKGFKEKLMRMALHEVEQMEQMFISKNLIKLDSIVEKKGNFQAASLLRVEVRSGNVEGDIRVSFQDGDSFDVNNQIVWSRSIHGKPFTRYPTTFHNVKKNGEVKKMQPEIWMNERFVK